ncbi:hypothetical protein POM88_000585 [Heracleum sosnowskyi]|uniref:Aminotransferase-like plant mobile domain-containing protein n=1 Tax=Heracleum sosnowskyi TaxID=360622 RepID=A0AAD8N467_9APIA|nr:hypothetical protein POM88_000585 [Heracleum sosnowskyi]
MIDKYAWAPAILGYLYRQLYLVSRRDGKSISGCVTLIQLWAYDRLLPGRPKRAINTDLMWLRALAWGVPVDDHDRRENPHHHLLTYHGMFDFVMIQNYGRSLVPLICWGTIEYQMLDRVLRQFGMLQHIPEALVNMNNLRKAKVPFKPVNYRSTYSKYVAEWNLLVNEGVGIVRADLQNVGEYLSWYWGITKLRIGLIQY